NIPSRARSAVVMPDTGLPPGNPCQAPSFLWSPPALKQATRAFRLAGDRISIGARGSLGARRAGQISSFWGAGPTAGSLSVVMFAPQENGQKFSGRLHGWQNTENSAAASCKNVRSTEKEYHSHVVNSL